MKSAKFERYTYRSVSATFRDDEDDQSNYECYPRLFFKSENYAGSSTRSKLTVAYVVVNVLKFRTFVVSVERHRIKISLLLMVLKIKFPIQFLFHF